MRDARSGPGSSNLLRLRRLLLAGPLAALGFLALAGSAAAQVITEFPIPTANSQPFGITAGPDGNLWFAELNADKIGKITTSGTITEFNVPTAGAEPRELVTGPDNNLWFTEDAANKVAFVTTGGTFTEFTVPTASSFPSGITAGPDNNLWFTEESGNQIGRVTTAGVFTEFAVPTASGGPRDIVTGPDGALWFCEREGNKIGRVTTAGAFTEFDIPTAGSAPRGIAVGSDGNLWFTEELGDQIGRITTAGVVTEFPINNPGSGTLFEICSGSDNNLWFTDQNGNRIGRSTTAGVITEFDLPIEISLPRGIASGSDDNLWFTERGTNKIGRITTGPLFPLGMNVDTAGNHVLEPGESVTVSPIWKDNGSSPISVTGAATSFTGPPGATYTINDGTADYGTIAAGASTDCATATGDCYNLSVSMPASRPSLHWDAMLEETMSDGTVKLWRVHIGQSFTDVPSSNGFYRFVETLLHDGVTAGCGGTSFCPGQDVTRAQMSVFLLVSDEAPGYSPPACSTQIFNDVPCTSGFSKWINELFNRGVTAGCGGGNYCPNDSATRAQMAVFLLKTLGGTGYNPPPCTVPTFQDVPCTSGFAPWVDELAARGITAGCGGGNYCPNDPVTRGQMSVFLTTTFNLLLYGP